MKANTQKHRQTTGRSMVALLGALVVVVLVVAIPTNAGAAPKKVYSPHKARMISTKGINWIGFVPATWYGPGFWGNRTGCGTTLRKKTWGIAHRSLPCGKMVYVSHKGKRIAVPVIDRGPYSGAVVDLTERVAQRLDFKGGSVRIGVMRQKVAKARL